MPAVAESQGLTYLTSDVDIKTVKQQAKIV